MYWDMYVNSFLSAFHLQFPALWWWLLLLCSCFVMLLESALFLPSCERKHSRMKRCRSVLNYEISEILSTTALIHHINTYHHKPWIHYFPWFSFGWTDHDSKPNHQETKEQLITVFKVKEPDNTSKQVSSSANAASSNWTFRSVHV